MKRTRIAYLLFLHYIKSLSPEEERELQEWRTSDRRHEELMREVTDSGEREERQRIAALFDEKRAWERLQKQTVRKRSSSRIWQGWLGAAAVVAGICLLVFFYVTPSTDEPRLLAHTPALLPPQDGVILSYNQERKVLKESSLALADSLALTDLKPALVDSFCVEVPRGNTFTMILDDGTKVYLNSDTKIQLPRQFSGHRRDVQLFYGEAYFEVTHDSDRPFMVHSRQQRVQVLGTSFGIRAYADEPQTLTTLVAGSVRVKTDTQENCLVPGDQSLCSAGGLTVRKVDTALYTSWHQGVFVFRNESLDNILQTLSRWYDVQITYTDEALKDMRFTGELKRYKAVNEFLERLELVEKVRFSIQDRTIRVSSYY